MARLSVVGQEADSAAARLKARIAAEEDRGLLRFLTCGSVDDGKSTLIGRLLYNSAQVSEDQLKGAERDSKRPGASGVLDLALLVDGLQAEREQKITIDVAYRYFSTPRRKFIVADTPGHVQYTRNMATGASNCDFAVLLVDARNGVLTQTRRHACIVSLLGIRKLALTVNKMDLVDFDQARFDAIAEDFSPLRRAARLRGRSPASRSRRSRATTCSKPSPRHALVSRPHFARPSRDGGHRRARSAKSRSVSPCNGSTGRISISAAMPGPSPAARSRPGRRGGHPAFGQAHACRAHRHRRRRSRNCPSRRRGDPDLCRGGRRQPRRHHFASPDAAPSVADQIAARIVWFDEEPMLPGRAYAIKAAAR